MSNWYRVHGSMVKCAFGTWYHNNKDYFKGALIAFAIGLPTFIATLYLLQYILGK